MLQAPYMVELLGVVVLALVWLPVSILVSSRVANALWLRLLGTVVAPGEVCILERSGVYSRTLGEGAHLNLKAREAYRVKLRQSVAVEQTHEGSLLGVALEYAVEDPVRAVYAVCSYREALVELVGCILAHKVEGLPAHEVALRRVQLEIELVAEVNIVAREWGLRMQWTRISLEPKKARRHPHSTE